MLDGNEVSSQPERRGSSMESQAHAARASAKRSSGCGGPRSGSAEMAAERRRVLDVEEAQADAIVVMADHLGPEPAENDLGADRRARLNGDGRARDRHIDDAAGNLRAVRQSEARVDVGGLDALVTARLGNAEGRPVDEPCQLGGDSRAGVASSSKSMAKPPPGNNRTTGPSMRPISSK